MSVSTTLNKVVYTGNGTTKVFGYTFYVLNEDDITLYLVDVATEAQTLITTNFLLSPTGGNFPAVGGTITYPVSGTALDSTKKIVIVRENDLLQPTVLPTNTALKPKVVEMSLDRATMQIQQVAEEVGRCVKVQIGSTTDPDDLVDALVTASSNAVTAAANAQTSETNAAASALSASNYATNASNSATSAASSALTATNAASTAAQDATDIIAQYVPFRFNSTSYALGDIARSTGLPSYAYAECTVAGTTGTVEPTWPAVGSTVVDDTVTWLVRDVKQCDTLRTARTINGVNFNGSSDITTITKTDYINSGRKFGTPISFDLPIESGDESISYKTVIRTANSITLNPRKAVIVCDKVDGTTDKIEASLPSSTVNTVNRWIINGDSTISSTVGTNNLTKTGTITASDGRTGYAGLGAGGHYTAANATNIPAYASAFTLIILIDRFVSTGAAQCFYHDGPRKVACNASNNLLVGGVDTKYTLDNGSAYIVEVKGAGGTTSGDVFVNGVLVFSGAVVVNATLVTPFILSNSSSAELCYSEIGYIEILSAQTATAVSGEVAANLIIPVCWTDTDGTTRKSLKSLLPTDSISLGYAYAGSSGITDYNDSDWMYGRREKAYDGNRRKFLVWQTFSGAVTLDFANPFGTRKLREEFVYAQDQNGKNECSCSEQYYNATWYGVGHAGSDQTSANRITCYVGAGGATMLNGAWMTSGYIGCYVEVLEDD